MPHESHRSVCVVCFAMGLREVPQEGERWEQQCYLDFSAGSHFFFTTEIQMKRTKAEELEYGLVAGRSAL